MSTYPRVACFDCGMIYASPKLVDEVKRWPLECKEVGLKVEGRGSSRRFMWVKLVKAARLKPEVEVRTWSGFELQDW